MRINLLFAVLIVSITCFSQENTHQKCKDGIEKAELDFKNGKAHFDYSRIDIEFDSEEGFENFYQIFMYSKYSIERDNYLNHKSIMEQCYHAKMDSLIRKKHGNDIYLTSRRKAKEIFDSGGRDKKSEVLDLSKYYIYTESPAKFNGNDILIKNSLKKMFEYSPEEKSDFEYRTIGLLIDRNGKVVDFKSHTDKPMEKYSKNLIITELNKLGDFVPAYLYDIRINSILWIDLWEW